MLRKRKQGTPAFKLPAPFNPVTGGHAELIKSGVFPYVAMMQVAAPDTERDYVLCRGFDVRIGRFIDYENGNADKPGIPVAKPYSKRTVGAYTVGQIFPAVLPLQTDNPSPADVLWRVGQNPGVAKTTAGHPADLDEEVEALKDANDVYINWMLLDSAGGGGGGGAEIISFRVLSIGYFVDPWTADHFCRTAQVEVLSVSCTGASVSVGDEITVWDPGSCHFDIPIEILYNMRGTAVKMAWDAGEQGTGTGTGSASYSRLPTGIPPCFSNASVAEIEDSPYAGACWWLVQSMCCVEDWFDN